MVIFHTMKQYFRSPSAKFVIVGVLTLVLMIPMAFVTSLVEERQWRYKEVEASIAKEWGARQYVAGPMILIPVVETVLVGERYERTEHIHVILPDTYDVDVRLDPSTKNRGLFSVGVYRAELSGKAAFNVAGAFTKARIPLASVLWDRARIVFPITDTRSIDPASSVLVGDTALPLLPGNPAGVDGATGVYAEVPAALARSLEITFDLTLNGSAGIELLPVGNVTRVSMSSSALAPNFQGGYLPNATTIDGKGFQGEWTISALGRSFPQVSTDLSLAGAHSQSDIDGKFAAEYGRMPMGGNHAASIFGVSLVTATDFYVSVERSTKYALLFVGLTFLTFFLVEVLTRARVHPIQYVLVGAALALFYLLLLALSEHVGFGRAYAIATAMTVGLVGVYVRTVLRSLRFAVGIASLLALLYGYLYAVLRMDDYALMFGTFLLFLVLAGVMYATRKVDWYGLDAGTDPGQE